MYIYSVTVNIEKNVEKEWLDWMRNTHIPAVLNTKKFNKALMSQVMIEEEMGGVTYSVQYTCNSKETLQAYHQENADALRQETERKFAGKYVAFRTELQIIQEFK
ncbi:MAG: hypothetical protein COB60_08335 [Flavobacteriaceae bacterium]|nr:MAG: hypothetical protein COB60_08335 [Flavobacteriaceae bacterium]